MAGVSATETSPRSIAFVVEVIEYTGCPCGEATVKLVSIVVQIDSFNDYK
jgi:hypothetical protein